VQRSLPTLTMCDISGWRTFTVNFVPRPNVASVESSSETRLGRTQANSWLNTSTCNGYVLLVLETEQNASSRTARWNHFIFFLWRITSEIPCSFSKH